MKGIILIAIGAAVAFAGVFMSRLRVPPCPHVLVVAELVEDCFANRPGACALFDRTVSASCFMERANEATEAKFQYQRDREEIVL